MINPIRRRIRQARNRRRLRNGARRAKGIAGHVGAQIRDGLIQTAGVGAVGLGLSKLTGKPKLFDANQSLIIFRKRLTKQHKAKISRSLRNRTSIDQYLKRGETISKIFRSYAGGARSLAAAKKYTQEVGRSDTVLRRLDRLSTIASRRRQIFPSIANKVSKNVVKGAIAGRRYKVFSGTHKSLVEFNAVKRWRNKRKQQKTLNTLITLGSLAGTGVGVVKLGGQIRNLMRIRKQNKDLNNLRKNYQAQRPDTNKNTSKKNYKWSNLEEALEQLKSRRNA